MTKFTEKPTICPFCNSQVELMSNSVIYGREYGNGVCYKCINCDSYTGVHDKPKNNGDYIALGLIANREMRELKKQCHAIFDPVWKENKDKIKRKHTYFYLADHLEIEMKDCHFGHFDLEILQKSLIILEDFSLEKVLEYRKNRR